MGWFRRCTQQTEVEQISNPLFGAIADTRQQELQDSQLRSPAGLEQLTTNAAHASTSSSCPSRVSASGQHAPAALVLPADDPSASSSSDNLQGLAADSCVWTPGTVGPDSPSGPLHVPAGHCKPHASTPKPAHRMSCPAGAQHAIASTGQAAQGHSSRVSWQDHPGHWSGSSSGSWTAGSTASPCSSRAAAAGETAAHTLPQAPRSRPTSAIQRHVHLQLQQQQQRSSSTDRSAAAGAADEDDMFADMCACLDNLQAAAQLARTESGLKSDKLPAAIAGVRASFDESRRTSSSRPSSAGAAPQAASGAGSAAGALRSSNVGGCAVRSSSDGSGAAAATSGDGSLSRERQLARGRSRLQASTSNACLAEEDLEEEDSFCHLMLERSLSILRHSSVCTGDPVEQLLVVTVGPDGASVPLTGQRKLPVVQARPSSGSSGASAGMSGSIGSSYSSSSRGSSMDKGSRSSGSAPDSPASLSHTRPPPKAADSLQEQQERQRLQELRQQKQEQVVASYGCPSPHSPSRASQLGHSHLGGSRPCSGRDAGALHNPATDRQQQQQHVGGAGRICSSGPGGSAGGAAGVFDTTRLQPASLSDAWAVVQTGTPKAPGTGSLRPLSASVAGSLQAPLPTRMLSAGAAQSPRAAKAAPAATASPAAAAAKSYQ